jgi:hypothetical protein
MADRNPLLSSHFLLNRRVWYRYAPSTVRDIVGDSIPHRIVTMVFPDPNSFAIISAATTFNALDAPIYNLHQPRIDMSYPSSSNNRYTISIDFSSGTCNASSTRSISGFKLSVTRPCPIPKPQNQPPLPPTKHRSLPSVILPPLRSLNFPPLLI